MSLQKWAELPLLTRKSPKRLYTYLEEELGLEKGWEDLSAIERRSRHKQYLIIQETVTDLPAWSELSPFERRNPKKLYNKIKIVAEEGSSSQTVTETRNISFTINDGTNAIGGATVTIGETSKTTGSAGGCSFNSIPDGETTVEVEKYGYGTYNGKITVGADSTSFTISLEQIIYDFTSYDSATKDNEYATGTAACTGTVTDGYAEIEVLTNSVEGFEGNKYYIQQDAEVDGETPYQLFSDAGTTGTGLYVTISMKQ